MLAKGIALTGFAVCLYLAWKGLELAFDSYAKNEHSGSMWNPPRWPLYLTMPIGLGLTALQYVAEWFRPDQPGTTSQPRFPDKAPDVSELQIGLLLFGVTMIVLFSGLPIAWGLSLVAVAFLAIFKGPTSLAVIAKQFMDELIRLRC